jgi:hypothetical protein
LRAVISIGKQAGTSAPRSSRKQMLSSASSSTGIVTTVEIMRQRSAGRRAGKPQSSSPGNPQHEICLGLISLPCSRAW